MNRLHGRLLALDERLRTFRNKSLFLTLGLGLVVVSVLWGASLTQPWQALNLKTLDLFTTTAAPGVSEVPVVILAIDEPSFQKLQHAWPFPRSMHARLLDRLRDDGALAVGLDVLFSEPSASQEDAELERAISEFPGVVLAAAGSAIQSAQAGMEGSLMPLPRFLQAGAFAGDSLVQPDRDFVVRHSAYRPDSFAARLAVQVSANALSASTNPSQFVVYRGPRGTFETRSYYEALQPGALPPGYFRGKVVLVGRSALTQVELGYSQSDLFNSPFAALGGERLYPGVELQATLIDNQVTGARLNSADPRWTLLYALLALPLVVWASRRLHAVLGLTVALALAGGAVGVSWGWFAQGLWLPPLYPVLTVLAVYVTTVLDSYVRTRHRARMMRSMFAQYVPPEVVSRLVARPELLRLGGEVREVTVMFTDLANFTTLSEQLSAQQTVEVLTAYFNAMTPIIHASGGTVDKFIGDAVMAFWGAPLDDPQHAANAVRAGLGMQAAMHDLAEWLRRRGLPEVEMRIGIHTGRVVVGNVGSNQRFSYTAIGDAVNVAARLEGANKVFGTRMLVSGATVAQLPEGMALRALDDVIVRGRSEAVRVYTPCDDAQLCTLSAQALHSLQQGDWEQCEAQLQALAVYAPDDLNTRRLLARVRALRASVGAGPQVGAEGAAGPSGNAPTPQPPVTALELL